MRDECKKLGRDPKTIEVTSGRAAPDVDGVRRLADLGVSRFMVPPPAFDPEGITRGLERAREADRALSLDAPDPAMSLGRALVDFVTGRPEVRNRVKFFLLSPIYDGFYRLFPENPHAEIARRIAPGARRLLDVCTGTALVPALVTPMRPDLSIVGLDLSPEMFAVGRDKLARQGAGNATLVRADAGTLPFGAGVFDVVTVSYGLDELPTAARGRTVREIRRVLKPGGAFLDRRRRPAAAPPGSSPTSTCASRSPPMRAR